MAAKEKAPFKKGDKVKVTRGEFKAKGTVAKKVPFVQGLGGGEWYEVNIAAAGDPAIVKRYRESNLEHAR